jgi:hypothetical protein
MAKWAHANVLDQGPAYIRGLAATPARVKQYLVKTYAAADSYATVVGNAVASADMSQAELTLSSVGTARKLTVAAKPSLTATAASGANPDLHQVLVDATGSAVLLVTDETADASIGLGETVNLSSWSYTVSQPA